MRIVYFLIAVVSLCSCNDKMKECLRGLANQEIELAYDYLQLASKVGAQNAYPGFASLFTKLSDDGSSRGHELVKYIALRKLLIKPLIKEEGIKSRLHALRESGVVKYLDTARDSNNKILDAVKTCHEDSNDASAQDYLESHLLDHHIEVGKLFDDLLNRIKTGSDADSALITYMVDEELVNTYGDRRKDVFA